MINIYFSSSVNNNNHGTFSHSPAQQPLPTVKSKVHRREATCRARIARGNENKRENCRVLAIKSTLIIDFLPTHRHVERISFAVIRSSRSFHRFEESDKPRNATSGKFLEFIGICHVGIAAWMSYKAKSETVCLSCIISCVNKLLNKLPTTRTTQEEHVLTNFLARHYILLSLSSRVKYCTIILLLTKVLN